jgi:hypothetical protein
MHAEMQRLYEDYGRRHALQFKRGGPPAGQPSPADWPTSLSLVPESAVQPAGQVQNGLNLCLRMKSPAQMPALLSIVKSIQRQIDDALAALHYVHFARFLPSSDGSQLWVITVYDGDLQSYLMDFVKVLGDPFNAMLMFVVDAPRLPVQQYPRDFCAWVQ